MNDLTVIIGSRNGLIKQYCNPQDSLETLDILGRALAGIILCSAGDRPALLFIVAGYECILLNKFIGKDGNPCWIVAPGYPMPSWRAAQLDNIK